MIRTSAVGGLRVNCQPLNATTIRVQENMFVDSVEYSVITAEERAGEITVDSVDDTPFGLMVHGHRKHGGYCFTGNAILR
jgi:hypothetical protein